HKFEAGTPNVADIAAFGAAVDYLQSLGFEALRGHEEVLVRRTLEVLRADDRVKVFGPADGVPRGGVVSFSLGDVHPHDAGQLFDAEGVELRVGHHCCQPLMRKLKVPGTVRVSFHAYNTLEEVEAFARALRKAGEFFKIPAKVNG
ncbi:MAG: aminotransferase class V-fold PLP-dependent enzyme, partial [Elusimicrobiota bacterium]